MDNKATRKSIFTFLATIVIAASIYFSAYFAVNTLNSKVAQEPAADSKVSEGTAAEEKPSLFAGLVNAQAEAAPAQPGKVLGAEDSQQATNGAVPSTGSGSMAAVVILGSSIILLGVYLGKSKARAAAIKAFEKDLFKRL